MHHFIKGLETGATYLCQACDSGQRGETPKMPVVIDLHFFRHMRTRTDPAHFAAQDIDNLGKFVEPTCAQPTPDARHVLSWNRLAKVVRRAVLEGYLAAYERAQRLTRFGVIQVAMQGAKFI